MAGPDHTLENRRRSLEVHLLGLVDVASLHALLDRLSYEISGESSGNGALLLCEHPPHISLGRDARTSDVLEEIGVLERRGIAVEWVSRGGPAICHAPGQLAIYPVIPLSTLGIGVDAFRVRLETAIVAVCREVRIAAKRQDAAPGVWTRYGQVAMVGAAVRSWVTTHGAFLNVTTNPGYLKLVASTRGERTTSLESLRLAPVSPSQVREAVVRHLAQQFGYDDVHTSAGHPLLRRTLRRMPLNA